MPITHRSLRRVRRKQTVFFDLSQTSEDAFDRTIEVLLAVLLIFSPLALGAVQAWSELVVIALAAAMSLVLAIKLIRRTDASFVWSWTYWPIAGLLALIAFQLLPLPAGLVRAIAPNTFELRNSLLSKVPDSASHLASMPLSLYPEATLHDFRLLVAVAAAYVVTLNTIRRTRQMQRLLMLVAGAGAVTALVAFAHLALDARHAYGWFGDLNSDWPIAPFFNRNHFGQFMNLSLGAAMAVVLMQADQVMRNHRRSSLPDEQILLAIPPMLWATGAAIVILAVGVFLSLSRGAMVSMAISGAIAALVARRQGMRVRVWLVLPLAWGVILLVIYFGFDVVVGRFAETDMIAAHSIGGRIRIVEDVIEAWKQFPIFGTGMGTFETVYPMFDSSTTASLATHAENEYAQMLMEGGVLGVGLVIAFGALIASMYWRCIRSGPSVMSSAAIGLGYGLVAIMLHSASDFGQHLPANSMVTAILCAMLVTLAEMTRRTHASETNSVVANRWGPLAGVGMALAAAVMVVTAVGAARAERSWSEVRQIERRLAARNWRGEENEYARLLIAAGLASSARPADVHYHYSLNEYRWRAISRERDPQSGKLLLDAEQIGWADRIAQDLLAGAWRCPTFGPTYLLAGQIRKNVLGRQEAADLIRLGHSLSRTDPAANFEVALLDAQEGNWDAAMKKFQHAAELSAPHRTEGIESLARDLKRPDLALELAGNDVQAVRAVVRIVEKTGDTRIVEAKNRLRDLIRSHASAPHAPAVDLIDAARLAVAEKDYRSAADYYRRALSMNYGRSDWRLELAAALAADHRNEEAMEEARIAQRMGSTAADAFILQLRLKPARQQDGSAR